MIVSIPKKEDLGAIACRLFPSRHLFLAGIHVNLRQPARLRLPFRRRRSPQREHVALSAPPHAFPRLRPKSSRRRLARRANALYGGAERLRRVKPPATAPLSNDKTSTPFSPRHCRQIKPDGQTLSPSSFSRLGRKTWAARRVRRRRFRRPKRQRKPPAKRRASRFLS